jgi:hypothetical protein
MQQGNLVRTASIVEIILIGIGSLLLLCFASPLILLVQAVEPRNSNLVIPIFGGRAIIGGFSLLSATDPRSFRRL